VLKNLIDWLSRPVSDKEPQVLAGKPAAISGTFLERQANAFIDFIKKRMDKKCN